MNSLKICDGCGKQRKIWKNLTEDGVRKRLCKECWSCQQSHSSKPIKKHKPLAPRSTKRIKEDKEYSSKRKIFMVANPICQANIPSLCSTLSTDVHHTYSGADRNKYYLDETTWVSICRNCHNWIHAHSREARELGLLK